MDRSRIARRLGGPAARRRRHRRVAALLAGVLVVALVLLLVAPGDDGDDDEAGGTDATVTTAGEPATLGEACEASNREIAIARSALLRDNEAPTAAEEFLGDAFVDLARDRSAAIRALDPAADVLEVLADFDAVVDRIEADPTIGLGQDPFVEVDARWAALGLDECQMGGGTVPEG